MRMLVLGWKPGLDSTMKDLGCEPVVVLDDRHLAKYPELSDGGYETVRVGDFCDVTQVLSALSRRGLLDQISRVHTDQEPAVIPAAVIGRVVGDSRVSVEAAIAARDKFVQKQRLSAAGIPVADHDVVEAGDTLEGLVGAHLAYPRILKPVSGGGTRDTSRVDSAAMLQDAWHDYRPSARAERAMLLESFVEGREIHLDGVMTDGELGFLSVSRYTANLLDVRVGATPASVTLDPGLHPELYQRARPFTESALNALGLRATVFHLEAFETADGLVFSECGARAGGGFVTNAVYDKYGIDLRRIGVQLALGHRARLTPSIRPEAVGFILFAAPPGVITALPSPEQVLAYEGVTEVEFTASVGTRMSDGQQDTAQRPAMAVLRAADERELEDRIRVAGRSFAESTRTTG